MPFRKSVCTYLCVILVHSMPWWTHSYYKLLVFAVFEAVNMCMMFVSVAVNMAHVCCVCCTLITAVAWYWMNKQCADNVHILLCIMCLNRHRENLLKAIFSPVIWVKKHLLQLRYVDPLEMSLHLDFVKCYFGCVLLSLKDVWNLLIELRFYVPLGTKLVISEMMFSVTRLSSTGEL